MNQTLNIKFVINKNIYTSTLITRVTLITQDYDLLSSTISYNNIVSQ